MAVAGELDCRKMVRACQQARALAVVAGIIHAQQVLVLAIKRARAAVLGAAAAVKLEGAGVVVNAGIHGHTTPRAAPAAPIRIAQTCCAAIAAGGLDTAAPRERVRV